MDTKTNFDGNGFTVSFSADGINFKELSSVLDISLDVDEPRQKREIELVDQTYGIKKVIKTTQSSVNNDLLPDKVIFNDMTTILISGDDKYVVRCGDGDRFDPVFGFLYGYFLMNNGMSKTQAAKFFDEMRAKCDIDIEEYERIIMNKDLTIDEYVKAMNKLADLKRNK